jgi:hypothetical protein
MKTRTHVINLTEAVLEMVLAEPVDAVNSGIQSQLFPAGHQLTEDSLLQLALSHIEFISILEPDYRSSAQVAIDAAVAAHRVMEIFSGADLSNPVMAVLFDQVLTYRSTQ